MTDKERKEIIKNYLLLLPKGDLVSLLEQYMFECKSLNDNQNAKAVEALEKVHIILADAIIEITEPLDVLDFQDLEKIARCFENKIDDLIKEYGGGKNESNK